MKTKPIIKNVCDETAYSTIHSKRINAYRSLINNQRIYIHSKRSEVRVNLYIDKQEHNLCMSVILLPINIINISYICTSITANDIFQ